MSWPNQKGRHRKVRMEQLLREGKEAKATRRAKIRLSKEEKYDADMDYYERKRKRLVGKELNESSSDARSRSYGVVEDIALKKGPERQVVLTDAEYESWDKLVRPNRKVRN